MFLNRSRIIFLHDLLVVNFSFSLALGIRLLDEFHWRNFTSVYLEYSSVFFIISALVLRHLKLYQRSWRYSTERDYLYIIQTCLTITMVYALAMFVINRLTGIPRSVIIVNCILMPLALSSTRVIYRMMKLGNFNKDTEQKIPVLIIGLDNRIELFLREMFFASNSQYMPIGIIDNNKTKIGSKIYNVEVYGSLDQFDQIYQKLKKNNLLPKRLIVTEQHDNGENFKNLLKISDNYGIKLARLPRITELQYKLDHTTQSQPIIIEDLLAREQSFWAKDKTRSFIRDKIVMVTGAGGTIGGELVKQVANFSPKKLIILDNSEFNLYQIINELEAHYPMLKFSSYIADIRHKKQLESIFCKEHPQILFHAAALKHVPLVESNISEGISTNIYGTMNIARLVLKQKCELMVLISTDKAVNPTNVMGATKRIAEKYIQGLGQKHSKKKSSFIAVRFGNVLGSSGSVIPLFEQQIKTGGPITVTDPKVERYFMTLREAVQLVLQAAKLANKDQNEHSHIYVLDMGKSVLIKDLAEQMITLSGLKVGKDIKIAFTGLRPGEKLYEELFYEEEQPVSTEYKSILVTKQLKIDQDQLTKKLVKLALALSTGVIGDQELRLLLKDMIPEYSF